MHQHPHARSSADGDTQRAADTPETIVRLTAPAQCPTAIAVGPASTAALVVYARPIDERRWWVLRMDGRPSPLVPAAFVRGRPAVQATLDQALAQTPAAIAALRTADTLPADALLDELVAALAQHAPAPATPDASTGWTCAAARPKALAALPQRTAEDALAILRCALHSAAERHLGAGLAGMVVGAAQARADGEDPVPHGGAHTQTVPQVRTNAEPPDSVFRAHPASFERGF